MAKLPARVALPKAPRPVKTPPSGPAAPMARKPAMPVVQATVNYRATPAKKK